MTTDFSQFQKKELTKPRDKGWNNFAKFEKAGDSVTGILRDVFYQKAEGQYPERRAFTLELADGTFTNIAIKRNPYFAIRATNDVHLGDLLTVKLAELRPSKIKGYNATKIYTFEAGTLPENTANPTVKELEAAEMAEAGVADTKSDSEHEEVPFN
jgi:acetamidase/formamidase